jgi:alkyl sulfatase BDS1-like metallo-beta-lactamase superfamily hydrolase
MIQQPNFTCGYWPTGENMRTVNGHTTMNKTLSHLLLLPLLLISACDSNTGSKNDISDASSTVLQANAAIEQKLDLADPLDLEEAQRGLIAKPAGQMLGADGQVIKDFDAYSFLEDRHPDTVHPSLWRHAKLNAQVGLFKVTDGVYQLRGFDIANMTLIQGKTGLIVIDPLTSTESAAFALAFARQHLNHQPITGLIFTHAHADHFGGALGVMSAEEVIQRKIPVVAPMGFMAEATSENMMVGNVMARRSMYQFGKNLPHTVTGNIDTGLGKEVVYGSIGILPPNVTIDKPAQPLKIDGVNFVFYNQPGAESPAEMTFSLPDKKLYNGAENMSRTMHNLLPIRGAKVRDALLWAKYLQQSLDAIGDTEVFIAQHHHPIWGNARIREFITVQRDVYKYTHDQTVRLMNQGLTALEIAESIQLPESLATHLYSRGFYGDLRHNVKAVYQFYLGFYDGNPANLNPHPPTEAAKRYIKLIGADRALSAAQTAYTEGDFRWAAELLNHVVMADNQDQNAKALLAKTYQQMAYMSEAATWRNAYLTAAQELNQGVPKSGISKAQMLGMLQAVPTERFLEAMAAGLNGPDAAGKNLKINLILTDTNEQYVLWIENAVLHFMTAPPASDSHATLSLSSDLFVKLIAGVAGVTDTLLSDDLKVTGSQIDLVRFFSLFDKPPATFPIVSR